MKPETYDAVIIGARVAGAATAMLLAKGGARVLLVDREAEIGDTMSTHALMRPAVSLLARWGLLDRIAASTPAVTQTRFHYGPETIDIPFKPEPGLAALYAPRRWSLDRLLGVAAEEAGATLRTGLTCVELLRNPAGRVVGALLQDRNGALHPVHARMVVGADGRNSTVAQLAEARTYVQSEVCATAVYAYADGLPNEGYRWYYDDDIAGGLIPTTGDQHCVFIAQPRDRLAALLKDGAETGIARALDRWEPAVGAYLRTAGFVEGAKRYLGAPGHMRQCAGEGWALVGDAGYFKDPLTAHGITDAFRDAQILSQTALATGFGPVHSYQSLRDALSGALFQITAQIASFDWSLEQVKRLHFDLNKVMKREQSFLAEMLAEPAVAA